MPSNLPPFLLIAEQEGLILTGEAVLQDAVDKIGLAGVYNFGVEIREENGYSYQIATPEKALCDKLYTILPVGSVKAMRMLLFEDLRVDESDFWQLNLEDVKQLAPLYKSTNHKYLAKLIDGGK